MTRITSAPARALKPAVWGALLLILGAGVVLALWLVPAETLSPQEQLVAHCLHLLKEGTETMRQITERGSATLHREAFQNNVRQVIDSLAQCASAAPPTDPAVVKSLTRQRNQLELWAERYAKEFRRLYNLPDFMAIMQEAIAENKERLETVLQQQRDRPGLLALFPGLSPLQIPGR
jgi:hypothetical protein